MGYGATFSDDQRNDPGRFDQALADWTAVQEHPDIATFVDSGGRASAHRRDTLVVATRDLADRRLIDNLRDIGVSEDERKRALAEGLSRGLGFSNLRIGTGQCVVAVTQYLRGLGGRRPLHVGPDHVLWPFQGRTFFPASLPRPPKSPPTERAAAAQAAKAKGATGAVKVAVLDTGYIAGNPLTDVCTASAEPDPWWDPANEELLHWVGAHGTHAAGVLADAAGGAVRIHHRNVSSSFGSTMPLVADSDLAAAVADVLALGCRVLNLSLGGPTALDLGLSASSLVIGRVAGERKASGLQRDDAVIVAAAGNEGTSQPMYPAAFCGVVGVGAIDAKAGRPAWSNYGPWVDCASAGVDVLGPHVRGKGARKPNGRRDTFEGWAEWSGTSFAAPFVSGHIAAAMAGGIVSARVAAATVLSNGLPLDPSLQVGVQVT